MISAMGAILWLTGGHAKPDNIGMLLFPGIIGLIAWGSAGRSDTSQLGTDGIDAF